MPSSVHDQTSIPMHPVSPSANVIYVGTASPPGPVGLDFTELVELRELLKEKRERDAEAKKNANSFTSKAVAFYEDNKILSIAIQFIITVVVAFVLGYFSLKGQVDDAKSQARELSDQLSSQQSQVNAVTLNVGALQTPVANLVNLVSTLNVQALQANITDCQRELAIISSTNAQLKMSLQWSNTTIYEVMTTAGIEIC
jgi:hypothetical protein